MAEPVDRDHPRTGGWLRLRDGRVIHDDTDEHVALVARTLGIDAEVWRRVVDRVADDWRWPAPARPAGAAAISEVEPHWRQVIALVKMAFLPESPHATPLPFGTARAGLATPVCPVCGSGGHLVVARKSPQHMRGGETGSPVVYARCEQCGHGFLVDGAAAETVYSSPDYYERKHAGGEGYDGYGAEAAYREARGARLIDRISALAGQRDRRIETIVEVGSGFGFTRLAAERRGMRSTGVDVNPFAARAARDRHGLDTFVGTLAEALASGRLPPAPDLVLHQFVLEHLVDPRRELSEVARALAPGGLSAVLVPSMEAVELDAFGASYRSFRRDHLHLFSRASLARCFAAAGLSPIAFETAGSLHLLRGFLDDTAVAAIDDARLGPDLLALAIKAPP